MNKGNEVELSKAHLWWSPNTGLVKLQSVEDMSMFRQDARYTMDCLGTSERYQMESDSERLAIVMAAFVTLTTRDGVCPKAVHRELCKIKEYRNQFPGDARLMAARYE